MVHFRFCVSATLQFVMMFMPAEVPDVAIPFVAHPSYTPLILVNDVVKTFPSILMIGCGLPEAQHFTVNISPTGTNDKAGVKLITRGATAKKETRKCSKRTQSSIEAGRVARQKDKKNKYFACELYSISSQKQVGRQKKAVVSLCFT